MSATAAGTLLLALGLVVSGCGSGAKAGAASATTAATTTTTTTATGPAGRSGPSSVAFAAYRSCLKAHGVTTFGFRGAGGRPRTATGTTPTPPPTSTSGQRPRGFRGTLTAKQRAAFQACRSKLPSGARSGRGFGRPGRSGGPGGNPAFARYTACLAKHGVEFGSHSAGTATFAKAQAACRALLPAPGGTTTTTG
jgi:hypothetical protein